MKRSRLSYGEYSDEKLLAETEETQEQLIDGFFHTINAQKLYLQENFVGALSCANRAHQFSDCFSAYMALPMLTAFRGLSAAEIALAGCDQEAKAALEAVVQESYRRTQRWASECPHNVRHCESLLQGALAALEQQEITALAHFASVAAEAGESGFLQLEGIAHQCMKRSWARLGISFYESRHGDWARECFKVCGAVRLLSDGAKGDGSHETTAEIEKETENGRPDTVPQSTSSYHEMLVKVVRRLSRDIEDFESLKVEFATSLAQAVGARKAVLLLERDRGLSPVLSVDIESGQIVHGNVQYPLGLMNRSLRTRSTFVVVDGLVEGETEYEPYFAEHRPCSAFCKPLIHQGEVAAVLYVENELHRMDLSSQREEFVDVLAAQAAISIRNAALYHDREREVAERTRELSQVNEELAAHVAAQKEELAGLSRLRWFLSPRVASFVVQEGGLSLLERTRIDIAVIFCDLRDFTEFANWSQPEQQQRLQSEYRQRLDELFIEHDATVDHWAGDGAMVFIGAPERMEPPTAAIPRAVDLALEMRAKVRALVESWKWLDIAPSGFGIGITYGTCWVGLSGRGARVDYSAGGHYVNLCSRLCDHASPGEILITNAVRSHLPPSVSAKRVAKPRMKGLREPGAAFSI